MEIAQIIPHVEALIFASEHPLTELEIVDLLNNSQGFLEDLASLEQVQSAIEAIEEKYQSEFYSFGLKKSGGGYQFLTKPDYYPTVAQLNGDKYLKKLSVAALETLSIIAYKQPVTKSEIEAIRGVNSDYSIQKLLEKELIIISGRKEDAIGKPLIYATSKSFMDYFGLNSPEDLPKIKEVLQDDVIHPTTMPGNPTENDAAAENENGDEEGNGYLAVSETGELLMRDQSAETWDDQETAEEESDPGGNSPETAAGDESNNTDEEDKAGKFYGAGEDIEQAGEVDDEDNEDDDDNNNDDEEDDDNDDDDGEVDDEDNEDDDENEVNDEGEDDDDSENEDDEDENDEDKDDEDDDDEDEDDEDENDEDENKNDTN